MTRRNNVTYWCLTCMLMRVFSLDSRIYQSFVVLSNFCHLPAPCYLFTFYVISSPYKCTCCTHHTHNNFLSLLPYRAHALCANIPFSLTRHLWSSCHLDLGGSRQCWGFLEEQTLTFIGEHVPTPLASSDPPPSPIQASLLCLDPPCLTAFDYILHLLAPPA